MTTRPNPLGGLKHHQQTDSSIYLRAITITQIWALIAILLLGGCRHPTPETHHDDAAHTITIMTALSDHTSWQEIIDQFHASTPKDDIPITLLDITAAGLTDTDQHIDLINPASKNALSSLIDHGLLDPMWDQDATQGVPITSIVSFVVRSGNPHHIHDWADLIAPGISVMSTYPTGTGWAQWPLVGAYGAASQTNTNRKAGLHYLTELITEHMPTVGRSEHQSQELFLAGHGDVLLGCEYANLRFVQTHPEFVHLIPTHSLRVEIPMALTTTSNPLNPSVHLRNFQYSPRAQRIWAQAGFRPVDPTVAEEFSSTFPPPAHLISITDLGGWDQIDTQLFEHNSGLVTRLYRHHFPTITPSN